MLEHAVRIVQREGEIAELVRRRRALGSRQRRGRQRSCDKVEFRSQTSYLVYQRLHVPVQILDARMQASLVRWGGMHACMHARMHASLVLHRHGLRWGLH